MVPGINKLIEVLSSGIGAVAGPMMAPWKAKKEGEAKKELAKAEGEALLLRTGAHIEARKRILNESTGSV